ncbi:MAG: hypothetical protein J6C51_00070 [Clostridia bacterium]|nr:hypothetical protein [Clostridia bacterium]
MDRKKLLEALLFPHIAFLCILTPAAASFLIHSMLTFETNSLTAVISYVLAFYTLTAWCIKAPRLFRKIKAFKKENRYMLLWQEDARLRANVSLYIALIWNTSYALLQLGMGLWHKTFWFCSLSAY